MCDVKTIIITGNSISSSDVHLTFTNSFQGKDIPLIKVERIKNDNLNKQAHSYGYIHLYKDEVDQIVEELIKRGYGRIENLEEIISDRKDAHDILINKFMNKIKNVINKDGDVDG